MLWHALALPVQSKSCVWLNETVHVLSCWFILPRRRRWVVLQCCSIAERCKQQIWRLRLRSALQRLRCLGPGDLGSRLAVLLGARISQGKMPRLSVDAYRRKVGHTLAEKMPNRMAEKRCLLHVFPWINWGYKRLTWCRWRLHLLGEIWDVAGGVQCCAPRKVAARAWRSQQFLTRPRILLCANGSVCKSSPV